MKIELPVKGVYRHYKGSTYTVIGCARHSETEEWLVVYKPNYAPEDLWVRPAAMFSELVEVEGLTRARFELVSAC